MAMPVSLVEKVRNLLIADDTGEGPWSRCGQHPAHIKELTPFQLDLRDWGMVYGVAFGLARTEEPCESYESVAERALPAARSAWSEIHGPWHDPTETHD